jgi:hypothetical protein
MWTGEVDVNWAKEHHYLWLQGELANGRKAQAPEHTAAIAAD